MQIFTMRYNLKYRKLTLYGLTRPQSIRKSKQISGQTILSSPQDLEFNPNFATFQWLTHSVTQRITLAVLTTDTLYVDQMPNSSIQFKLHLSIHLISYLEESLRLDTIFIIRENSFCPVRSSKSTSGKAKFYTNFIDSYVKPQRFGSL